MWKHWVARTCTPYEPFQNFELSRKSWWQLKALFPELIAAVFMPNHIHLIVPTGDTRRFAALLGSVSKFAKIQRLWQPIPQAAEIPDRHHLRRHVRYIALNPCRKSLCSDPLEWYWSTYREIFGAATECGDVRKNLTTALREPFHEVRFHTYVSADPSVRIEGTPPPQSTSPKVFANQSIGDILSAASAALRLPTSSVERKGELRSLFIHLAHRHGWRQIPLLANICKVERRSIYRTLLQPTPKNIEAADLCLGDPRLRKFSLPHWTEEDQRPSLRH